MVGLCEIALAMMIDDWNNVIWTNESSSEVGKQSCQIRVLRKVYERNNYVCLAPTFKSMRTSIMEWGALIGSLTLIWY